MLQLLVLHCCPQFLPSAPNSLCVFWFCFLVNKDVLLSTSPACLSCLPRLFEMDTLNFTGFINDLSCCYPLDT